MTCEEKKGAKRKSPHKKKIIDIYRERQVSECLGGDMAPASVCKVSVGWEVQDKRPNRENEIIEPENTRDYYSWQLSWHRRRMAKSWRGTDRKGNSSKGFDGGYKIRGVEI